MSDLSLSIAPEGLGVEASVAFSADLARVMRVPEDGDAAALAGLVAPAQRSFLAHTLAWAKGGGGSARIALQLVRGEDDLVAAYADIEGTPSDVVRISLELDEAVAARRAETQIRQILENAHQALTVRVGERAVYANRALADLLGYASVEDMRATGGQNDHMHPDDADMVRQRTAARAAGHDEPESYEFRMVRADGSVIWVECAVSAVAWNGAPASMAWLIDITERKRAEEALRRSEKLFGIVFQACPDLLTISRLDDGRFVDVNDSFVRLLGYDRDVMIGRREREIGIFLESGVHHRLLAGLNDDAAAREVIADVRTRDGRHLRLALSCRALRFADRDLVLTVGRDVSDRLRVEEELRQSKEAAVFANRAKSEFLANMSHELRTPLNAVIGFSEVLAKEVFGPLGNERYVDYARDIFGSGQHLLQIINDLLDLSKLEAGKQELYEAAVAVPTLVETSLNLVRERATSGGLTLATDLPVGLPSLFADERLLKQIMINLLSNAVKFTAPGGSITVSARIVSAGGVELEVADTGIGMTATELKVALSPFGQVDSSMSRQHQGTGLGLPLVRSLAELHGGSLRVASAPDKGTVAIVSLPPERVLADA